MDIRTLVKTVIGTYEDAVKLVTRIKQERDSSDAPALPEEPTSDLLNSLALGPMILRGHYDHDLQRFGERYACGDIQAREQLKDVLISLQMALITGLNRAWMDDGEIDYHEMQAVSDDSRVNAGVCLGQLSQRLSDEAKTRSMYSQHNGMYPPGTMLAASPPALQYSSSRSTDSSRLSRAQPRTPSTVVDDFANLKLQSPAVPARPAIWDRDWSLTSSSFQEQQWTSAAQRSVPSPLFTRARKSSLSADTLSIRRPSSHCLSPEDSQLLSPSNYDKSLPPSPRQESLEAGHSMPTPLQPGSQETLPRLPRTSSANQSSNSASVYASSALSSYTSSQITSNDYCRYSTYWEARQARSQQSQHSYRGVTSDGDDYSTLEHIQYLQTVARPPIPDSSSIRSECHSQLRGLQHDAHNPPLHGIQRLQYHNEQQPQLKPAEHRSLSSAMGPIPVEQQDWVQTKYTLRQALQPTPSLSSLSPSTRTINHTDMGRPMTLTPTSTTQLTLPTDKNTLGFCKGAFRLFIGLEKKAFSINNRPIGISGVIPYWKCEKCTFEGPCITNVTLPKQKWSKAEKTYDLKIRECSGGGVRYKWAFLAKCHVCMKSMPDSNTPEQRRGEYGSFGCIFCACEAQRRGWTLSGNDIYTEPAEAVAIKKGKRQQQQQVGDHASSPGNGDGNAVGGGAGGGTPIFGNVNSFMEHLQVHRREEMMPGIEMLGRMKGVAGRAPERGEEFDIAFLPL